MKRLFRRRQRIYTFPNVYGFIAFGLFGIMLMAGATYQNNLIFAMAFLVISLALIAILQTARNLREIDAIALHVSSHFSRQLTQARLTLINRANDTKFNLEVVAEFRGGLDKKTVIRVPFEIAILGKGTTNAFVTSVMLPKSRGRFELRRISISTKAPYGLFRAWIYARVKSEFVVYPEAKGLRQLPITNISQGEDFSGHKTFAPGDFLSRIDWKVYSKRREFYVKEFNEGTQPQISLTLLEEDSRLIESKLSQLSLWIDEAYHQKYEFRLETKNSSGVFGSDSSHYHRCLTELALWSA